MEKITIRQGRQGFSTLCEKVRNPYKAKNPDDPAVFDKNLKIGTKNKHNASKKPYDSS